MVNFVERLQHDETTFDADLSATNSVTDGWDLEFNPVLAKYLPEPGWLMEEFETGDSIVRVDSVANGSCRLLLWNKDKMFSAAPELIIPQGRYDAKKNEYLFKKGDDEYVFDEVAQKMKVLY